MPILEAHMGVSTECPGNTHAAFAAAVRQGYQMIELDPNFTSDGQLVVLHDNTINRTARKSDGSRLSEPVEIQKITWQEACRYDYGLYFSEKFRGEKLPLLKDVFSFAGEKHIQLKIDNKFEKFPEHIREKLYEMIRESDAETGLTVSCLEQARLALEKVPELAIHYDGPVEEGILKKLSAMTQKLTVWLPLSCERTSWAKVPFANRELCAMVKNYARLGIWIITNETDYDIACEAFDPDVIETDGCIKPRQNVGFLADMHTHSQNSHDSVCPVSDMAEAEKQRGIGAFAVTDHCDIQIYDKMDVLACIRDSVAEAEAESEKQKRRQAEEPGYEGIRIMKGIELGDGVWHEKTAKEALDICEYDIVLASVHTIRYRQWTESYSRIDFTAMPKDDIYGYIGAYFEDVLSMIKLFSCDVLAHLTCPLRYITGKHGIPVDLAPFEDMIQEILQYIIAHGIALEINTQSINRAYGDFVPDEKILQQFRAMGGYLITLGSDAHAATRAANGFEEALAMMRRNGVRNLYYYEKRMPVPYAIDEDNIS